MKAWQFSLDISANIGICGVGGRFEVPEEVAIVSDLVLNKRLVEALCRNRCVVLLNSQMRRREGFPEPHAQAIGNSSQFSLRLLMLVDELRPKLTDLGRLPPPLAEPSHVLLLDLDLNFPGEERAIRFPSARHRPAHAMPIVAKPSKTPRREGYDNSRKS
jgi:hypothetical protein